MPARITARITAPITAPIAAPIAALVAALSVLLAAPAAGQSAYPGEVYAVYLRSDACPNCLVVDPALDAAKARIDDPGVVHFTLDLDDPPERFAAVRGALLDRGLADFYNAYLGLTGAVFLIAADSGRPVDCLTRRDSAAAMSAALGGALAYVRDTPPARRIDVIGTACPPPMRSVPG